MKSLSTLTILLILCGRLVLADSRAAVAVTYVSAEHVYIDAGRAEGVAIGDRYSKPTSDSARAELEVVFVALHSASCKLLNEAPNFAAGDKLILVARTIADSEIAPAIPYEAERHVDTHMTGTGAPAVRRPAVPVRLYGSASMVLYHWSDQSDAELDFTQTSARLNLRAENFWREHMTFAVRTRGRYDVRSRAYGSGVDESEWENRLWVLSLSYENPDAPIAFSLGRFLPRRLGSVGYLDGGQVSANLTRMMQAGVFAGKRPDWMYGESVVSLMKLGSYVSFRSDSKAAWTVDQSLGIVGEFHEGTANRTFVALSGNLRRGAGWGFSQSIELDVNGGWRKEKAGESLTLSNLYMQSWLRLHKTVRVTLQYDNRQNYWTYQYRSQADSLFDDRVRQGARAGLELSPLPYTWLSGSIGYRKSSGDADPTLSYSGSVRRSLFLGKPISLGLTISGFNGIFEHGTSYNVRAQLPVGKLGQPYGSIGGYSYSVDDQSDSRDSRFVEAGTSFDFSAGYFLGGSAQWNSGDDIDGWRFQLELGYRY